MRKLDDEAKAIIPKLQALALIAASNFPNETEITVLSTGKNSASIRMPSYLLSAVLSAAIAKLSESDHG